MNEKTEEMCVICTNEITTSFVNVCGDIENSEMNDKTFISTKK